MRFKQAWRKEPPKAQRRYLTLFAALPRWNVFGFDVWPGQRHCWKLLYSRGIRKCTASLPCVSANGSSSSLGGNTLWSKTRTEKRKEKRMKIKMTFALIGVGFLYRSIFHALMNSTREFSRRVCVFFLLHDDGKERREMPTELSVKFGKRENSFTSDFYSLLMNISIDYWWHKQGLGKHKLGSIVRPPSAWWFQRSLLFSQSFSSSTFFSSFSWQWQQTDIE